MSSHPQAIGLEEVRRSVLKLFEGKFRWKEVCNTTFEVFLDIHLVCIDCADNLPFA